MSREPGEYDAGAAVVGGESPVQQLSRPLRRLVKRGEVLFWRDSFLRGDPRYSLRLTPPFVLSQLRGDKKTVALERVQEEEGRDRLVFRGVCKRGFLYSVMVRTDEGKRIVEGDTVVSVGRGVEPGWGMCGRRKGKRRYVLELRWIKAARGEDDYAVDYEMWLYR